MRQLAAFAILLVTTVVLQWITGAYRSELGGYPDEPAHYVTGLMIRDYLTDGFPQQPLAYAQSYYDHYPKVALGNWPPMFYVMQGAWTLLFSASRTSVMALMGLLTAVLAWLIYRALLPRSSEIISLTGATLFIASPQVVAFTARLMNEIPIALFAFLAMFFFGRFLDRQRTKDSVLFGVFAAAAILTKASAMWLALAVPIALILTGRYFLLRRFAFWAPALIVGVVAGPWTWRFRDLARDGWLADGPNWTFTSKALIYYPKALIVAVGIPLFALALVGLAVKLRPRDGKPPSGFWSAFAGLLFSVLLMHLIIPCGYEARHLIPALPPLVLFVAAGIDAIGAFLVRHQLARPAVARLVWIGGVASFLLGTFHVYVKRTWGFDRVAERLLADSSTRNVRFLVSSDATGEGVFVAEIAMREQRPGHTIRRSSKVLVSSRWSGADYQLRFTTADDLIAALNEDGIGVIVTDESIPWRLRAPHHNQLRAMLDANPDKFRLEETYPYVRGGLLYDGALRVYRRR